MPTASSTDKASQGTTNPEGTTPNKNPKKRANISPASSVKRAKVQTEKIRLISEVGTEGKLLETPLANIKNQGVNLHCKVGNKPYIFNEGSTECILRAGTVIAGFGKGGFKHAQDTPGTDFNQDKDILYVLDGPQAEVILSV